MTNWATISIPKMLAPEGFNAARVCKCARPQSRKLATITSYPCFSGLNPFRKLSIGHITTLFQHENPEIVANKRQRFIRFLHATAAGLLFEPPKIVTPYAAHITYHSPPMWRVLQGSYADVEHELTQRNEGSPPGQTNFIRRRRWAEYHSNEPLARE